MTSPEEIWATRLQKELYALTTEEDNLEPSKKDLGVLPPFITVKEHDLNLAERKCSITFAIEIGLESDKQGKDVGKEEEGGKKEEGDEVKGDETNENDGQEGEEKRNDTDANAVASAAPAATAAEVTVTLDASLQYRPGTTTPDSSLSYPFFKPKAYLSSGADFLPPSKITNGSMIQIDCDWTPSLHLNDAILNIALKVRESVKRDEICLKLEVEENDNGGFGNDTFDVKVSSFFSSLKNRASAIAEEVDQRLDVAMKDKPTILRKKRDTDDGSTAASAPPKVITESNVEIGDVIDLSQDPWNSALGMYPCRAIRRPEFVELAMKEAVEKNNITTKVAGSGLIGAGSMFKSFSMQAKSLVEESFLVLTKQLVLEIKCSKFAVSNATVSFCIPISQLAKLKFRREESVSLFFKPAPDDPIIYMCVSSADAVKQIQAILKEHGVKGKHTNTTMMKTVQMAVEMLTDIKGRERALLEDPRPEQVTEIMDLYRQAAEKFEMAGDKRHEEVMTLMREFLAQPHVSGILDGSIKPQEADLEKSAVLEPVEDENDLETSMDNTDKKPDSIDDDDDLDKAMKAAEDMLNDAHDELKDLGVGDESGNFESDVIETKISTSSSNKDVVSEFEDMLADADKELEELMGS
mmetsp:Transcript_5462/g.8123  ORF Transcript_5462/g.8123 Transcript_5462/m.8123 type:complete len:638 (+) Transcript_5462:233-2146(+)